MSVLICSTADRNRTVVVVNGKIVADSARVCLFDEMDLIDTYVRQGASVTIATLPVGASMVF